MKSFVSHGLLYKTESFISGIGSKDDIACSSIVIIPNATWKFGIGIDFIDVSRALHGCKVVYISRVGLGECEHFVSLVVGFILYNGRYRIKG